MNRTAFKIAASAAMVALTMTSIAAPSGAMRRFGERANGPTDRQARQFFEQAGRALQQGNFTEAVSLMERAVAASPQDVGYRMLLADAYLLETAARSPMASARTRQNLALAYAFAGNWNRARAIAAQDISPAQVDERMAQWAQMARPGTGPTQVATLLGVSPGADTGRPLQVALGAAEPVVPGADRVQVAEAPVPSRAQFAPVEASGPAPSGPVLASNDVRP